MRKSASTAIKTESARLPGGSLSQAAEPGSSVSERLSFSKLSRHSYSSAGIDTVRSKPDMPYKHLSPFEVVPPKPKPAKQLASHATITQAFSLALRPTIKLLQQAIPSAARPQERAPSKLGGTETEALKELKQRAEARNDEQSQITSKLLEQMRLKEQNHMKKTQLSQRHLTAMIGKLDRTAGGLRLESRRGEQ